MGKKALRRSLVLHFHVCVGGPFSMFWLCGRENRFDKFEGSEWLRYCCRGSRPLETRPPVPLARTTGRPNMDSLQLRLPTQPDLQARFRESRASP